MMNVIYNDNGHAHFFCHGHENAHCLLLWYDYHNDNHCYGYGTGHIFDQHKGYNDDHDPVPDHEADYHDHDDGDIDYDLCQGNCYNQDHDHDDHNLHDHQCHDNGYGHDPDHAYDCNSDHLQNVDDNYNVNDGYDGNDEYVDDNDNESNDDSDDHDSDYYDGLSGLNELMY